jgi:hypothetical protein
MKKVFYWIGLLGMHYRGWQIELLPIVQKFFITKDEDLRCFDLELGWSRRSVYDQAIVIINGWKE